MEDRRWTCDGARPALAAQVKFHRVRRLRRRDLPCAHEGLTQAHGNWRFEVRATTV